MQLNQIPSWYKLHREFLKLSPNGRRNYAYLIRVGQEHWPVEIGPETPVNQIAYKDADQLYTNLCERTSLHRAVSVCRVLGKVWNVLIRAGETPINPFSQMNLPELKGREVLWTAHEVNEFIWGSVLIGVPSLGMLANLCYTFAQRPGDMRQLRWDNIHYLYERYWLKFTQEKTGKDMVLAIPIETWDELELVERVGPFICTNERTGRPFSERDYNHLAAEAKIKVGLPEFLQLRDLRRTALTQAAENGASDSELMLLGGHTNRDYLNIYQVHTLTLAVTAMQKRFLNTLDND